MTLHRYNMIHDSMDSNVSIIAVKASNGEFVYASEHETETAALKQRVQELERELKIMAIKIEACKRILLEGK